MTSRPPIPPPFNAAVEPFDGGVRVRFAGELDLATVADAEAAIARARADSAGPLDVDLSELTFLDSTGLQLIMELHRTCSKEGCVLTIGPGPRGVQRVFDLARVLDILPFR